MTQPENPFIKEGDIFTIGGVYNRPPAKSLAWWCNLLFGKNRKSLITCCWIMHSILWRRHSQEDEPINWVTRRELFQDRKLLTFKAGPTVNGRTPLEVVDEQERNRN